MKRKSTEHHIQCAVIYQCRLLERQYPELKGLIAIPNGGARHPAVAAKLKKEGVRKGVPDLFLPLPIPRGPAGLWLVMKSPDGKVSASQKDFMEYLQWAGYKTMVCYSHEEAVGAIVGYLEKRRSSLSAERLQFDSVFLRRQAD